MWNTMMGGWVMGELLQSLNPSPTGPHNNQGAFFSLGSSVEMGKMFPNLILRKCPENISWAFCFYKIFGWLEKQHQCHLHTLPPAALFLAFLGGMCSWSSRFIASAFARPLRVRVSSWGPQCTWSSWPWSPSAMRNRVALPSGICSALSRQC